MTSQLNRAMWGERRTRSQEARRQRDQGKRDHVPEMAGFLKESEKLGEGKPSQSLGWGLG